MRLTLLLLINDSDGKSPYFHSEDLFLIFIIETAKLAVYVFSFVV